MKKVGACEAKSRLSMLLDEVRRGARISITKRGIPVAMLVPVSPATDTDPLRTVRTLREFRKGITLGGISIRELIEEGRRQ